MYEDLATGNGDTATTGNAFPTATGAERAVTSTEPGTALSGTTSAAGTESSAPGGSPADTGTPGDVPEPPKRKRGRPKGSTARTTRVVTMTLTVSGSADGDWQAELKQGTSWVARGLPVSAAAVAAAATALHEDLAGPVTELIETAKAAKAARVAELEAELEQARKDLAELEG